MRWPVTCVILNVSALLDVLSLQRGKVKKIHMVKNQVPSTPRDLPVAPHIVHISSKHAIQHLGQMPSSVHNVWPTSFHELLPIACLYYIFIYFMPKIMCYTIFCNFLPSSAAQLLYQRQHSCLFHVKHAHSKFPDWLHNRLFEHNIIFTFLFSYGTSVHLLNCVLKELSIAV